MSDHGGDGDDAVFGDRVTSTAVAVGVAFAAVVVLLVLVLVVVGGVRR